jgi:hypothetical protein
MSNNIYTIINNRKLKNNKKLLSTFMQLFITEKLKKLNKKFPFTSIQLLIKEK